MVCVVLFKGMGFSESCMDVRYFFLELVCMWDVDKRKKIKKDIFFFVWVEYYVASPFLYSFGNVTRVKNSGPYDICYAFCED